MGGEKVETAGLLQGTQQWGLERWTVAEEGPIKSILKWDVTNHD